MAGNSLRKSLNLCKSDQKLLAWRQAVQHTQNINFSYLITAAINYYLTKQSYMVVGQIMLPDVDLKPANTSIFIPEGSKAFFWIQELSAKPESKKFIGHIIKEILKNSIRIVTNPEEIYIPSYLDIERVVAEVEPNIPNNSYTFSNSSSIMSMQLPKTEKSPETPDSDYKTSSQTSSNELSQEDEELLASFLSMKTN